MRKIEQQIEAVVEKLGGEKGLRRIATEALQRCCDDHLAGCIRDSLKLQFGWPDERGSQVQVAEFLEMHEGSLSRFKKGVDDVFLRMPHPRRNDILWRLNIDPENIYPDRETVLLAVMRATLTAAAEARRSLGDESKPPDLSDESLEIIAQLSSSINPDMLRPPLSRTELEQVLRLMHRTLSENGHAYVRSGQRFGNPLALLKSIADWIEISEVIPYQFALLLTLEPILKSVSIALQHTVPGYKDKWLSDAYAENLQRRIADVIATLPQIRHSAVVEGADSRRPQRFLDKLQKSASEDAETWKRVCRVRRNEDAGAPTDVPDEELDTATEQVYLRLAGDRGRYRRLEVIGNRSLAECRDVVDLNPIMVAWEPRPDVIALLGHETLEFVVRNAESMPDIARNSNWASDFVCHCRLAIGFPVSRQTPETKPHVSQAVRRVAESFLWRLQSPLPNLTWVRSGPLLENRNLFLLKSPDTFVDMFELTIVFPLYGNTTWSDIAACLALIVKIKEQSIRDGRWLLKAQTDGVLDAARDTGLIFGVECWNYLDARLPVELDLRHAFWTEALKENEDPDLQEPGSTVITSIDFKEAVLALLRDEHVPPSPYRLGRVGSGTILRALTRSGGKATEILNHFGIDYERVSTAFNELAPEPGQHCMSWDYWIWTDEGMKRFPFGVKAANDFRLHMGSNSIGRSPKVASDTFRRVLTNACVTMLERGHVQLSDLFVLHAMVMDDGIDSRLWDLIGVDAEELRIVVNESVNLAGYAKGVQVVPEAVNW